MHQIAIDVPRTAPQVPLFRNEIVRESIARILYCWSIRRPASGYVQGINDLITPFYSVFLSEYIALAEPATSGPPSDGCTDPTPEDGSTTSGASQRIITITQEALFCIEADTFWCLSRLLDNIQDNYTFNQVGITRNVHGMREILKTTNRSLLDHLAECNIDILHFAFRWMNCLLVREFPLHIVIRMWDTYLAEGDTGFSTFHTFVCAALLSQWAPILCTGDFQHNILFLQNPPTANWTVGDVKLLLSQAYLWKRRSAQTAVPPGDRRSAS